MLETCERLLAESAAIPCVACAGESLPPIGTPRVLFVDRENYLFAMTASPGTPTVWKTQLLAGVFDETIAAACAHLLATLHGKSWQDPELSRLLADRSLFDELRIDPYYRTLAAVHSPLRPELEQLIASTAAHRLALVHADFSPKNLLVGPAGLMMVDFETGHFGDPAFDLGFFQSHLILKAFYHAPRFDPLLRLSALFCADISGIWPSTSRPASWRTWSGGRCNILPHAVCANRRQEPGRLSARSKVQGCRAPALQCAAARSGANLAAGARAPCRHIGGG